MDIQDRATAWLANQDVEIYFVGGCVRDRLLGRPVYDLDVATSGDALRLARQLANQFRGDYHALDEVRGTGRAILASGTGHRLIVDVARFRGPDLGADLADRDFTINALAADVRLPGVIIDRHGGLADLDTGVLRAVSGASICNDPVRALRAVRLAAELGFSVAPDTESLLRRDGPGLRQVSGERIRDELARLLALPRGAAGLVSADELGLLTIVIPELEPLRGLAQPPPHHLDALSHSFATVDALETLLASRSGAGSQNTGPRSRPGQEEAGPIGLPEALTPYADLLKAHLEQMLSDGRQRVVTVKLAALLHDVGKPQAWTADGSGRVRFLRHQEGGSVLTAEVLRRLRFNNNEVRLGAAIVQHHMRPLLLASEDSISARAVYRYFRDTGEAGVDTLLHALADHRATRAPGAPDSSWPGLVSLVDRLLGDYWHRPRERISPPPLVNGADLMREFALEPGRRIGELLEVVREAQACGQVHTRDEALDLVRRHLAE